MKAIEQAIEALEVMAGVAEMVILPNDPRMNQCNAALAALREAVKQEPVANSVKIPTGEDEAALMVLTGMSWLKDNAPHRLKQAASPTAPSTEASEPVGEREAFEIELRRQCFQKPTPEAYDLAWSMWKARALRSYTTPPPAPVLSDAEIREIADSTKTAEPGRDGYILPYSFARAVEAEVIRRGGGQS